MATWTVQFITRDGAICGQTVTNRARAVALVETDWINVGCVIVTMVPGNVAERAQVNNQYAVVNVFDTRAEALLYFKTTQGVYK